MICCLLSSCYSRALDFPRENDGARVQMRLSYSPIAHLFLFLVQWTDCHLAGALGLLRILIYVVCFSLLSLLISFSFNFQIYLFIFSLSLSLSSLLLGSFSIVLLLISLIILLPIPINNVVISDDLLPCWVRQCDGLVQTYADGKTTMSVYERKASIREFYGE